MMHCSVKPAYLNVISRILRFYLQLQAHTDKSEEVVPAERRFLLPASRLLKAGTVSQSTCLEQSCISVIATALNFTLKML